MNIEANLKKLKTSIKRRKKITLTLMLGFLMTGVIGYAADPTVEELQKKIIELEKQIQEKNKEIEGKNKEIAKKNKEIEEKFNSDEVKIGKGAQIRNGGGTGSIAIGENATVHNYIKQSGGIAIGQNAYAELFAGTQEKLFAFNNKEQAHLMTALAIGNNTYARTGGIMIGPHNFRGKMGDIDNISTDKKEDKEKLGMGVYATTLGANSFTNGAFASTTGAYSIMTSKYDGKRLNMFYALQNFGAVINGSLNSIESYKSNSIASGVANSIVGVANRTSNSNGSLIFGAGNEITNSIEDISLNDYLQLNSKLNSPNDLAENLRKTISAKKGAGATLAIGGANKADYTKQVSMIGTRNEVKGTKDKKTELVSVSGDNNSVENSRNNVAGKNFHVIGEGNVLQGFNNIEDKKGFLEDEYNYAENIRKEKLAEAQKKLDEANKNLSKATNENNDTDKTKYGKQVEEAKKEVEKYKTETPKDEYQNKTIRNFVSNNNVVALGNDIKVSTDNSVYLGTKSANSKEENTLWKADKKFDAKYKEYAGFDHIGGIVSVGNDTLTRVIQNVAPGLISSTSTDAINGSQLYNYVAKQLAKQYITVKDGKGGETKVKLGDTITLKGTTVNVTVKAPDKTSTTSASTSTLASTSTSQSAQQAPAPEPKPQEHTVTYERDTFEYKLRDEKTHKDTTLIEGADGKLYTQDFLDKNEYKNNKWVKKGTDTDSENISENQHKKTDGNVILSTKYNKIISGVADGTEKNDAVNLGQLDVVKKDVKTNADNIEKLQGRVTEVEKKSDLALSGVSNAVAMANLPQVMGDKKFNLAASYGYYGGSHALAIGFSGTNDKQNFIYKLSGSVNNKGNLAFGIGAGVMLGEVNNKDKKIENLTKENKEIKENLRNQSAEIQELKEIVRRLMKK